MKGVLLAGGKGSRVEPLTSIFLNKHLVKINGRKMIEYALDTLKFFDITEILLVTSPEACGLFVEHFKDGSNHNVDITYKVQKEADGVLGALKLAKNFVNNEHMMVILGDNTFKFNMTKRKKKEILEADDMFFIKNVKENARDYGVLTEFGIVEKMNVDKGDVVTGLYLYDPEIFDIIDTFEKSARGEYEISDLNNFILSEWFEGDTENIVYRMKEKEEFVDMGSYEKIIALTEPNYIKELESTLSPERVERARKNAESFQSTPNFPPEIAEVFKDIVINLK